MQVDEQWKVAKFLSDRAFTFNDTESGFGYDHKPEMTVIAFVAAVVEGRGVSESEPEDGIKIFEFKNPYKDYEDYLRRTYSGGGWFISADEKDTHDGIEVRKLEIKVEKLTRSGPKRIVTWIFHLDDVDLAVQFEVLEDAYKKLKGDMTACLKSFKTIARTKGSLTPTTTGGPTLGVDEDELSLEDRTLRRRQTEKVHHERAAEGLPDGWTVKEMGRFLVLNHADDKYAKKVVDQAEAVWDWLDDTFPYIGPGEYVPKPILRICKDGDEESAFRGGDWFGMGLEIVTHKDQGSGSQSYEFEYVNRRVLAIWFNHHDKALYWALPQWLDSGLRDVLGKARPKGKGLEFKVDEWEREQLRTAGREGKRTALPDLLKMTGSDFWSEWHRGDEAAAFVRFLVTAKSKKHRQILEDYLGILQSIVRDAEAKEKDAKPVDTKAPETEEEEEERFKKRRDTWKEKEQELIDQIFERAFGDWTEKDWKRLADGFEKSL